MRIAANDGHAGQGRAVFRADDVDDTLTLVLERVIGQRTGFTDVGVEGFHLQTRDRVFDATLPMIGRRVVIGRGDDRRHPPGLASSQLQPLVGLRTGDFVHQMAINIDQRRPVGLFMHDMTLPELLV